MAYPGVFYCDDGQILRAMQTAADERRDDHDARRERHRDRRARGAGARRRARPTRSTTASPARGRPRPRRPIGRSCWPTSPARRSTSCTCRPSRPWRFAAARDDGRNVFGETCPQYLYLSLEDHLAQPGFEGAKWVCSTPLRAKAEHHQDELWRYLRTNDLPIVSAPTTARSASRSRRSWDSATSRRSPTASDRVEHRMDLIYQGVVDGRISLERWVEICSHHAGAHVRPVPAEGRHRARRRRRHGHLRPERPDRDRPATRRTT